jgi:hypothetical protein
LLAAAGLRGRTAWQFDLYGGTVLLAASRAADGLAGPDDRVQALLEADAAAGVRDPGALRGLQEDALARAAGLRSWLEGEREAGRQVLGYGAASRAVALLRRAGIDRSLLPAVADASPAKQSLRMPGTDIPVVSPASLESERPAAVLLFVPDLITEVRRAFPAIEAAGGRWVIADDLGHLATDESARLQQHA